MNEYVRVFSIGVLLLQAFLNIKISIAYLMNNGFSSDIFSGEYLIHTTLACLCAVSANYVADRK